MNKTLRLLAFDLGADSGRAVLGTFSDERIELKEIYRFPTQGIIILGTRQWDLSRIYNELLNGLREYVRLFGPNLDGIGIDTWGVDFGLVASDGTVLNNPIHYRDKRTDGIMERVFEKIPKEEIYSLTGIQFMKFNTIFQLMAMVLSNSPLLKIADSMLMMSDLFAYLLSGRRNCEYTIASTTQLLDPWKRNWHEEIIKRLGIPRNLFIDPISPGTVMSPLLPEIARTTGLSPETPVIVTSGHDTASAVAAVPVKDLMEDWAYISSGTWSLLGTELDSPVINEESMATDFTNEGGVEGKIRFLKNICGFWLLQECRREWIRENIDASYSHLIAEAIKVEPGLSVIDVDDHRLLAPENMPHKIKEICRETGQQEPDSRGQMTRCIIDSLAAKYKEKLHEMDKLLNRETKILHIIGGGVQNSLLCQMTSDLCGIPVIGGPIEATAMGNLIMQAISLGHIDSVAEGRQLILNSLDLQYFSPK